MAKNPDQVDLAERNENARTEYAAAHDAYIHYDNFAWQVGSVLLAGVFVYWGFIISNPPKLMVLSVSNLLVCLLMSMWLLYAEHNREIYLFKLHRIHELEKQLGMYQHRRFKDQESIGKIYILHQPVGHYLNDAVYIIVSLGGLVPGVMQAKPDEWSWENVVFIFLTLLIVAGVISRVHHNDSKTKALIKKIERQDSSENA